MAITVTRTTPFDADKATNATTHTFTVTASAAGSLLIAAVMDAGSGIGSNATGVTDNKSGGTNTWTQVARADSVTGGGSGIYATTNNAGVITTFTVALAGSGPVCVQYWEIAGAGTGSGTGGSDVKGTGNGTGTSMSSGSSGTPNTTTDLVIGVVGAYNVVAGPTLSAAAFTTAGGTFVTHNSGDFTGGGRACGLTGRLILAAATAQTFTGTNDFGSWGACVATWRPPATTSIKTINGLAQASVKTIDGLAIASVKTRDGLA